MPISTDRYYLTMIAALDDRGGVSPEEYHNLRYVVKDILGNVFIGPVPEDAVKEVADRVGEVVADRFMQFLDLVQTNAMVARPCDVRATLLEWLDQDIPASIPSHDANRYRALWACREFLRMHQPTSDEEMGSINATVARVYVDALTGQLGDSTDVIAAIMAAIA